MVAYYSSKTRLVGVLLCFKDHHVDTVCTYPGFSICHSVETVTFDNGKVCTAPIYYKLVKSWTIVFQKRIYIDEFEISHSNARSKKTRQKQMSHALLVTRQNIWWREYPELIQQGPLSSASKAGALPALRVLSRSTLSLSSHFYFDFRHQTFIFIMRGLSGRVIDVEFRAPVSSYSDAGWRICQLKLINWISWRQLRYSMKG